MHFPRPKVSEKILFEMSLLLEEGENQSRTEGHGQLFLDVLTLSRELPHHHIPLQIHIGTFKYT